MITKQFKPVIIIALLLALVLRIFLVFSAYHGDLNNNISWGNALVERGPGDFYEGENWSYSVPNQPPLTILMFGFLSLLWKTTLNLFWFLNLKYMLFPSFLIPFWEMKGMTLLVKLPSILADFGIALLIYDYFKKKKQLKVGLTSSLIWLFNPVVWYNSSIWGQTDSVVNFLGIFAIFKLWEKKLSSFLFLITLSVLFKGSLSIFVPLLSYIIFRERYKVFDWIKGIGTSFLSVIFVSIWFHPKPDLLIWLTRLYKEKILPGEIGFLTANAFNFWWLVDSGKTLDSIKIFILSARLWGFIIVISALVFIIKWLKKNYSDKAFFYSLSLLALISFLFLTRIHERYLYPFFPPATILIGLSQVFFVPYLLLSLIHLLNLYHLFWAPPYPFLEKIYQYKSFSITLSLINIGVFLLFLSLRKAARS